MYRRLKNILGVSLMILAIVISQVPMPEAQAEIVREMTDEDLQVDDTSAHVVTFSMNGGTFRGIYNGYSFQEKTPVLVIDDGKSIDSFQMISWLLMRDIRQSRASGIQIRHV